MSRIRTVPGARTAPFVPELDRLFLAVRAGGGDGAAICRDGSKSDPQLRSLLAANWAAGMPSAEKGGRSRPEFGSDVTETLGPDARASPRAQALWRAFSRVLYAVPIPTVPSAIGK